MDVPDQEQVDKFLAPVADRSRRTSLATDKKLHFSISLAGKEFAYYRKQTLDALDHAKEVYPRVEAEFEAIFGRKYGMVDEYCTDDADIVFLTAGSSSGTVKTVVDKARSRGIKVGCVRLRMFRPFPREALAKALEGKKAVACIERSICLGWNCGPSLPGSARRAAGPQRGSPDDRPSLTGFPASTLP